MKDVLEWIASHLVEDPDAVEVTEVQGERGIVYELRVAPDDMGKVIGRSGRTARAIRTVLRAGAIRSGDNVTVDIVE